MERERLDIDQIGHLIGVAGIDWMEINRDAILAEDLGN